MDIIRRDSSAATDFPAEMPEILRRVYAARGLTSAKDNDYQLKNLLPPATMHGIDIACERLIAALHTGERILVVGDFDADGATSCALALRGLRALGFESIDFLVPNRFEYGYGLTPEIVEVAREAEPELIVTVDNGIAAIDGVRYAAELGIDVLVTDHHLAGRELPDAVAIVNPNQPACSFESKALAGVGVMFYLLLSLRSALQAEDWFAESGRKPPNMAQWLDIVALGSVADLVPLDYNNRILVEQGLRRIRAGKSCAGINALLTSSGRSAATITAADLGFALGPRINAAGRMEDMSIGIRCLLTDDFHEAQQLAAQLDSLNRERRSVETGMKAEAEAALKEWNNVGEAERPNALCIYEPHWHQGVIGIVASRIKDRYHRPTIAFARADEGLLKGSARSISGLNIRDLLDETSRMEDGLIRQFGGHAMAAGLSLDESKFTRFANAFETVVQKYCTQDLLERKRLSDGALAAQECSLDVARQLRFAGPWGQTCPEPLFDGEFELIKQRLLAEKHLKMVVQHPDEPGLLLDAIAFNIDADDWPNESATRVKLLYKLDVNYYRGQENVQLMVEALEAC